MEYREAYKTKILLHKALKISKASNIYVHVLLASDRNIAIKNFS